MSDHGLLASSHSECNSRSSSGSDLSRESEGDVKREHVSSWSLEDLWTKRIFYNERESTLKELTDLVVQNSISNGNRHKFVCTPVEDTPEIMKQLVKHTQNALQLRSMSPDKSATGSLTWRITRKPSGRWLSLTRTS